MLCCFVGESHVDGVPVRVRRSTDLCRPCRPWRHRWRSIPFSPSWTAGVKTTDWRVTAAATSCPPATQAAPPTGGAAAMTLSFCEWTVTCRGQTRTLGYANAVDRRGSLKLTRALLTRRAPSAPTAPVDVGPAHWSGNVLTPC